MRIAIVDDLAAERALLKDRLEQQLHRRNVQADIPQNIDGISYLPTLTGKGTQKEHDCIYYEFFEFGGKQSIMTPDGWKLVRLEVSDSSKTYEELYNIYTDPAETTNVIKQYPDVARKLKNMIGGQRVENARFHF